MKKAPEVIVVLGPTASGKSDFAVDLSLQMGGEVISADSRQIYKGLDIGTGKIKKEEMKGVKHYMLDVIDPNEEFSVAKYKKLATPILKDILSRNKAAIICGGTGQYIDALIFDNKVPAVPPNKALRNSLEEKSAEELYNELLKKDKRRALEIDRHNKVRLIRALEIIEVLGKVPRLTKLKLKYNTKIYLLSPSRELLRERITKRLEERLKIGMIEEVENLMRDRKNSHDKKKFGLEYVSIAKFLEKKISEDDMKQEIITKSMQYAKRQETWNKKYLRDFKDIAEIIEVK